MPELLTDRETKPQRPGWLADDAVRGEPVSAVKTGTSRTGLRRTKTEAGTAPADLTVKKLKPIEEGREAIRTRNAQRRDGFQRHVAGALHRPFVVLFEKDRAGEADDGRLIRDDANHIGAPFDFAVEAFDGICGVQFGPMWRREDHIGEHVMLGHVHQGGKFRQLTLRHCCLAAPASSCAKAVAMKAETTRRPLLPAWASALRIKWTRGSLKKPSFSGRPRFFRCAPIGRAEVWPCVWYSGPSGARRATSRSKKPRKPPQAASG